jgi:hypothetical protein
MGMRRHLLVLDMDLPAADEKFDLEPVNYLVALEEQGPCEAVVLSLANTAQARLPAAELLLGAQSGSSRSRRGRATTSTTPPCSWCPGIPAAHRCRVGCTWTRLASSGGAWASGWSSSRSDPAPPPLPPVLISAPLR